MDISISTGGGGGSNHFIAALYHLAPALIAAFVALFTFMVKNFYDEKRERAKDVNASILNCLKLAILRLMKAKSLGRVHLSTEVYIKRMDMHEKQSEAYKRYLELYLKFRKDHDDLQAELTDLSSKLVTHGINLTLRAGYSAEQRNRLIEIIDTINQTEYYYFNKIIIGKKTYRIDKMSEANFNTYLNDQNDQLERISKGIDDEIKALRLELRNFFKLAQ